MTLKDIKNKILGFFDVTEEAKEKDPDDDGMEYLLPKLSIYHVLIFMALIFIIVYFRIYKYLDPVHRSIMKEF